VGEVSQTFLAYLLYRLAGAIVPHIPPRWGYPLFSFIGDLIYRFHFGARQIVQENLRHVLGQKTDTTTIEETARQLFRNSLKNYYELFHQRTLSREEMRASLAVKGLEHIEEALAQGKGLVLVTAHFGSPDGLIYLPSLFSYRVTAPAEHLKPERLFRYLLSLRKRGGITFLPADGPLLGLFRALKRNEIVVVAADRDTTESGIMIDFFGAPARLPDGHVQLAMRTGAKLALAFGRREPDNTYTIEIHPPLELEDTGDFKRDLRANMEKVVAGLERVIRQHPEQWLMFYPLWPTRAVHKVSLRGAQGAKH
jgi:KDO2-lipid IV(A) lauroyltransferase